MIIELNKVAYNNHGDYLMALAMMKGLRRLDGSIRFALPGSPEADNITFTNLRTPLRHVPRRSTGAALRAKIGKYHRWIIANIEKRRISEVKLSEIVASIEICGYQYGGGVQRKRSQKPWTTTQALKTKG